MMLRTVSKGAVDVRQIGQELGVRYVLEGSVRKLANRCASPGGSSTRQPARTRTDRFDGVLENIFDLQGRVDHERQGDHRPKLEQAEIERAKRKAVENIDAYYCYLGGMARISEMSK